MSNILNTFFLKLPNFREYIELYGYLGIFLFFVTIDQLTFIPEEITLLTIGYFASQGIFNPILAGLISLAAFLLVDTAYFYFSKGGRKLTKRLRQRMGKRSLDFEKRLSNNFPKTLLILCFIPRMRMFAPIISGALKISYKKFLVFDSIGLFLFTGVYIALGMIFHTGLKALFAKVEAWQHIIFIIFILIVGVIIFFSIRSYVKERSKD